MPTAAVLASGGRAAGHLAEARVGERDPDAEHVVVAGHVEPRCGKRGGVDRVRGVSEWYLEA